MDSISNVCELEFDPCNGSYSRIFPLNETDVCWIRTILWVSDLKKFFNEKSGATVTGQIIARKRALKDTCIEITHEVKVAHGMAVKVLSEIMNWGIEYPEGKFYWRER